MYVDVIIPNFDESGEEVLLSTWYKKIGDKISNGEVIAEAETSTISCGITSGYDCFLSKILVQEGEVVSQGSRIAVIEVGVDKPTGVDPNNIRAVALEELENIKIPSEEKESSNKPDDENKIVSREEIRKALKDMQKGEISPEEVEKLISRRESQQNFHVEDLKGAKRKVEPKKEQEEADYTLSVPDTNDEDINDQENDSNSLVADELDPYVDYDEIPAPDNAIVVGFAEQAERKFRNILKEAENKAKAEANKMREKIIEKAKVAALVESESMKAKILKEFEDKASKDASEMHKKIVQGSISEAQNTKAKLIEEARADAKLEAEALKSQIKEEARESAEKEAYQLKQSSLQYAEKKAKEEADKISKDIIEKAIEESKTEANEIKKDILRSAGRHAKKESEQLIKDEINRARKKSQLKTEEIMTNVIFETKRDAAELKDEIINKTKNELKEILGNMMQAALSDGQLEINQSAEIKEKILEGIKESIENAMTARDKIVNDITLSCDEIISEMNETKNELMNSMNESIHQSIVVKEKLGEEMKSYLAEANNTNQKLEQEMRNHLNEINYIKDQLSEEIKDRLNEANTIKDQISEEIKTNLDIATSVKEKLTEEIKSHINGVIAVKEQFAEEMKSHLDGANYVKANIAEEIKNNLDEANSVKEKITEEMEEYLNEVNQVKTKMAEELRENFEKAIHAKEEINDEIQKNLNNTAILRNEILEEMRENFRTICDTISRYTRETLSDLKAEILTNADQKIQEIKNSCQAHDIAGEIFDGRIIAKQNEIVEKLIYTEQKLQELKDLQEKQLSESTFKRRLERRINAIEKKLENFNEEIQKKDENNWIEEKSEDYGKENESELVVDKQIFQDDDNEVEEIPEEKSKEDEMVEKLLNVQENEGGTPEMYADNWNKPKFFYSPDDEREDIDFLKQKISEKRRDAYDSSVIATVSNEVDMSSIVSMEKAFGEAFSKKYNTRLGFTPFFIMAAVEALKRYKMFNAHIYKNEIIYKNHFDISVITRGNDGTVAPVIRQADKLNLAEIEKEMITLSRRAIEGTLSIEEVSNGTFTVVNAGAYGSIMGSDILTPPQVATLSVHKMHDRPVAVDDGVEVKPMLYISLSYDHRIADTKTAAEFLENIKNYVENPGWQLLDL